WGGLTEQERHQVTKPATERRLRQRTSPLALTAVAVHMGPRHGGKKMTERTSDLPHDEPDDAPEGFREQPRYAPTIERVYANDRIEVTWEPAFCIHAAECLRGLPGVFDSLRRPWIIVDNGSPGEIGEVIQRCPTGALHFRRL